MSRFAIAIAIVQSAALTQGRNLLTGSYCDRWNLCAQNEQCWSSSCYPLSCKDNQNCGQDFQCSTGKCYPLKQALNNGLYCDQWTSCGVTEQCIGNKCVPLNCQRDVNCPVGFICYKQKCVNTSPVRSIYEYCDQWTPCKKDSQCVDKKCVPFTCQITPNCGENYVCNQGFCIQINNNHTRGRYCDAKNECDILHKCVDSQCVWK